MRHLLLIVALCLGAAPLASETACAQEPGGAYSYRDDLPRVGLVFAVTDANLNPAAGEHPWELPNRVEIRRAAGEAVAYTVVPTDAGVIRKALVFDHTGPEPRQAAALALGTRTTSPGVVVELTRGLFGLENPWCATVVGTHPVALVKGPGREEPVTADACLDLFTP